MDCVLKCLVLTKLIYGVNGVVDCLFDIFSTELLFLESHVFSSIIFCLDELYRPSVSGCVRMVSWVVRQDLRHKLPAASDYLRGHFAWGALYRAVLVGDHDAAAFEPPSPILARHRLRDPSVVPAGVLASFVVEWDVLPSQHRDDVGQPELAVPLWVASLHLCVDVVEHYDVISLACFFFEICHQIRHYLPEELDCLWLAVVGIVHLCFFPLLQSIHLLLQNLYISNYNFVIRMWTISQVLSPKLYSTHQPWSLFL